MLSCVCSVIKDPKTSISCGKNISAQLPAAHVPLFNTFWRHLWSIAREQKRMATWSLIHDNFLLVPHLTQYTRSIKSCEKIIHAGLVIGRLKKKPEETLALHVKSWHEWELSTYGQEKSRLGPSELEFIIFFFFLWILLGEKLQTNINKRLRHLHKSFHRCGIIKERSRK